MPENIHLILMQTEEQNFPNRNKIWWKFAHIFCLYNYQILVDVPALLLQGFNENRPRCHRRICCQCSLLVCISMHAMYLFYYTYVCVCVLKEVFLSQILTWFHLNVTRIGFVKMLKLTPSLYTQFNQNELQIFKKKIRKIFTTKISRNFLLIPLSL